MWPAPPRAQKNSRTFEPEETIRFVLKPILSTAEKEPGTPVICLKGIGDASRENIGPQPEDLADLIDPNDQNELDSGRKKYFF